MTGSTAIDVRQLINQRPLGAYQKLIVFLCFCIIALDGMDIAIMGFIAPSLKAAWGIGNAELAVVISAALIGLAIGAMVSGPLADWRGRKTIIIASVFLFGLWTLLTAFSQTLQHMVIFRFLTGLGLGAAMPNVGTLVSEFAPEKKRSFIITVVFCGFSFGAASGGFAASWMIPQWGWHSVLLMGGILPLLLVPFLLLKLPESVRFLVSKRADSRQIHHIVEKIAPGISQADSRFAMPVAEKTPAFAVQLVLSRSYRFGSVMLWGGYFFGLFMVYLLGSWLPTVIKEAGMSVTEATIITALYQAGGTFGSLFAGWLMDRVNPHLALGMITPPARSHRDDWFHPHLFRDSGGGGVQQRFLPQRRQHRHECAFRPLLPDGSSRHRLRLDAWSWPHGRHHERVCRRAGGQYGMGADHHVYYSGYSRTVDVADDSRQGTIRL